MAMDGKLDALTRYIISTNSLICMLDRDLKGRALGCVGHVEDGRERNSEKCTGVQG